MAFGSVGPGPGKRHRGALRNRTAFGVAVSATLYRSPAVIIGDHEWHLCVRKVSGRVTMQYYFRPLSLTRYRWLPITNWEGRKPALFDKFQTYRLHALRAKDNDLRRASLIAARERLRVAA